MNKTPSASLAGDLIAIKGTATPSSAVGMGANEKRVALTFKISETEYKKLKFLGIEKRLSTQAILEDALNNYFEVNK